MFFQLLQTFKTNNTKFISAVFFCLAILLSSACRQENRQQNKVAGTKGQNSSRTDYLAQIMAMDTLAPNDYKKAIYRADSMLNLSSNQADKPFRYYFSGRRLVLEKHRDSAIFTYQQMDSKGTNAETDLLSDYSILSAQTNGGAAVGANLMKQTLAKIEKAELLKSKITYLFYDLLAKTYYQNNKPKEALRYATRYYNSHPYKSHRVIEQRYFDISFLLATKLGDFNKMIFYNNKARILAKSINDSLALARTYDNEAQIYDRQGQYAKSLACSKIYFSYLKSSNNLNDIAFNNLATSFEHNQMPDSAIYYYRQGIAFEKKNPAGRRKSMFYNGLLSAYKNKGAYAQALEAADSAYTIEMRDVAAIEAVKIAELHEKYQVEKKDQHITELNSRNELYQKIITQQKWTLGLAFFVFLSVLFFLFILYRQQRLKGRNTLLASENKRLNIEQKLLQVQLNPHFIFNAIANLQGLISSGDSKEAVRYLSTFSKLLRNVLEQNTKEFIELDEEIASLHNYLQLQQMRFAGLFDYQISTNHLEGGNILIPPMLVQPFVENAIEHGFRNIAYHGSLTINFQTVKNQLQIIVDDNGCGVSAKAAVQTKKSLAQVILKERLDVLFNTAKQQAGFELEDKSNTGGRGVMVKINIPLVKD
ncbi:histidine kinase [Pedobacter soli]|uniref:Histidine kinase n=1 Tax=Pedobacter soli TaxID=390242 RepID=A0A1G6WT31_9SPHI|nr:histidine kinase [Pedobacter soli]SDD68367.1 Histidine kinase [Pedobacter soli]